MSDSQSQEKAEGAAKGQGHDAAQDSQPRAAAKPGLWKRVAPNIPLVIIMFKCVGYYISNHVNDADFALKGLITHDHSPSHVSIHHRRQTLHHCGIHSSNDSFLQYGNASTRQIPRSPPLQHHSDLHRISLISPRDMVRNQSSSTYNIARLDCCLQFISSGCLCDLVLFLAVGSWHCPCKDTAAADQCLFIQRPHDDRHDIRPSLSYYGSGHLAGG